MATFTPRNGDPWYTPLGKEDLAVSNASRVPNFEEKIPLHLPHVFLFTAKGPMEPQIVNKESAEAIYGAETFNLRGKYATHQTLLATEVFHQEDVNQYYVLQRLNPEGARHAYLAFSILFGTELVPEYERNALGELVLDAMDNPIPTGAMVETKTLKWVVDQVTELEYVTFAYVAEDGTLTNYDGPTTAVPEGVEIPDTAQKRIVSDFGRRGSRHGIFVSSDGDTSLVYDDADNAVITESAVRIPVFDLRATGIGGSGNNKGIRLWSNREEGIGYLGAELGPDAINAPAVYGIQMVERANARTTAQALTTIEGLRETSWTFRDQTVSNVTKRSMLLDDVVTDEYSSRATRPMNHGPFEDVHVYHDQVENLLRQIYEAEAVYHPDWDGLEDDHHRIDLISGIDTTGRPYESFTVVGPEDGGLNLNRYNAFFAEGGADGDMTDESFDRLVREQCLNWGDLEYRFLDMGYWPQNHLYDTGFSLDTKYAMVVPTARRKDMCVVLSTQDLADPQNSQDQDTSVSAFLNARARNSPESLVLGTDQCRVEIMPGAGKLANSAWKKDATLTLAYARMVSLYMGQENGKWVADGGYDKHPNHLISMFNSATVNAARYRDQEKSAGDWDRGMMSLIHHDRNNMLLASARTVYRTEYSPLHNSINVKAMAQLERIVYQVWQELLNGGKKSPAEFLSASDELIKRKVSGLFDDRFEIRPKTFFDQTDVQNGYSWHTNVEIYSRNGFRLNVAKIQSYQSDDFFPRFATQG